MVHMPVCPLQACSSPYIGYNISLHTSGSPYICLHIQVCSPISLHKFHSTVTQDIQALPDMARTSAISPSGEQSPDDYSGVDTAGGGRRHDGGRLVKHCPCPEQGEEKSSW